MKPFLKWAGNKYRCIDEIKKVLPAGKRLIEPFAGSGAVFLNTDYQKYLISEINPDLINLFLQLQQEGEPFIHYVFTFFPPKNNSESMYYELRECFNTTKDVRLKSAIFIYLNKYGYNGLCRYNSSGRYNVPFGHRKNVHFPKNELRHFIQYATKAEFIVADFLETMSRAKKGDVVYCDPPYVPLSKTANFTAYSRDKFSEEQQLKLVKCAEQLADRGITVVISNHDTEFVRDTYKRAVLHELSVLRLIGCDSKSRGVVPEILAVFK